LLINFPIKDEIQLSRFQVTINNKIVISRVFEKEKAKEKYSDSIAGGNVGILSSYDDKAYSYNVTIGNIKPKEKVVLITYYLQMISSEDMSFQYEIMQHYPNFISKDMKREEIDKNRAKNLEGKIKIKTQSRLTRLIIPLLDEKKTKFEKKYNEDYTEVEITISKNIDDIITKEPKKINLLEDNDVQNQNHYYKKPCVINRPYWFTGNLKPLSFQSPTEGIEPSFNILFRTELMNTPFIYTQYNPEKNNTGIALTFTYNSSNLNIPFPKDKPDEENDLSYYNSFQKDSVNDLPSLFVFLIDQSGSMSGKSIKLVKQALILFMQSLPPKSYFQLIGFGSDYEKYNQNPVEYNKENVESIMKTINQLRANKGGTNLFSPLNDIFNSKDYDNIDLSHNIFILTDGQINNRESVQNSISANVNRFRIHSIGIGNDFDKILIERCGKLGKGSSNFVPNVEEINDVVIDSLNKSLRPYLVKTKFDIKDIQKLYECPPFCNFYYQDDVINYSLLVDGKNEKNEFEVEINSNDTKKDIKDNLKINKIIKLPEGEILSRIIIGNYLKLKKDLEKEEEIKIAKEYQVLSKNTSLFGEIIGEGGQNELIKVELGKNDQNNRHFRPLLTLFQPNLPLNQCHFVQFLHHQPKLCQK
ncbi:MAG: VWA domain-containing protein, partial [Methanobrevibacter sp.]|nr:VWA domain-containing protein [Methanobrevibacter sp.]